jgi:hypothetical protein
LSIASASPTTNGRSSVIASDANKSPGTFCATSATAIPQMRREHETRFERFRDDFSGAGRLQQRWKWRPDFRRHGGLRQGGRWQGGRGKVERNICPADNVSHPDEVPLVGDLHVGVSQTAISKRVTWRPPAGRHAREASGKEASGKVEKK